MNLLQLLIYVRYVQEVQTWKETCPLFMRLQVWALPIKYIYNTNRLWMVYKSNLQEGVTVTR